MARNKKGMTSNEDQNYTHHINHTKIKNKNPHNVEFRNWTDGDIKNSKRPIFEEEDSGGEGVLVILSPIFLGGGSKDSGKTWYLQFIS